MKAPRDPLALELSAPERELLARRARRVSEVRAQPEVDTDSLPVCEFPVGKAIFAIPLAVVRAAVPLRAVTPVLLSASHVIGVMRFQGQVVCALSLSTLLGVRGWQRDPAILLIVERRGGALTALDCEQIPKPSVLPLAAVSAARRSASSASVDVITPDLRQVHLIDIELLLEGTRHEVAHGTR